MSADEAEQLDSAPRALREQLAALSASVVRLTDHRPRYHVRLSSPDGPLFAWYSYDPADRDVLAHELAVREQLREGPVRAPPVLAHGDNWRVERMLVPDEPSGDTWISLVVEAADAIAELELPRPRVRGSTRRTVRWARRLRLVASPLPVADVVRARAILADSPLPRVTSHGEFHLAHVLVAGGSVWVIDWECVGQRPRGFDLMQLWVALPGEDDRRRLFEKAAGSIGEDALPHLRALRYAALVQRTSAELAVPRQFGSRDVEAANRLLALLPRLRAELR